VCVVYSVCVIYVVCVVYSVCVVYVDVNISECVSGILQAQMKKTRTEHTLQGYLSFIENQQSCKTDQLPFSI